MTDPAPEPATQVDPIPEAPKVYLLQYGAGSDLEALHRAYEDAKAEAKAADDRYKSATAALKNASVAEAPEGTTSVMLTGPGGPDRTVSYVTSIRFDSKALKAADLVTYARYAKESGSWVLR